MSDQQASTIPSRYDIHQVAELLGATPQEILAGVKNDKLRNYILAEPLERQELLFHESLMVLARLGAELLTPAWDGTSLEEKRAVVDFMRPQIPDMWDQALQRIAQGPPDEIIEPGFKLKVEVDGRPFTITAFEDALEAQGYIGPEEP
jgi:hypothetical protein